MSADRRVWMTGSVSRIPLFKDLATGRIVAVAADLSKNRAEVVVHHRARTGLTPEPAVFVTLDDVDGWVSAGRFRSFGAMSLENLGERIPAPTGSRSSAEPPFALPPSSERAPGERSYVKSVVYDADAKHAFFVERERSTSLGRLVDLVPVKLLGGAHLLRSFGALTHNTPASRSLSRELFEQNLSSDLTMIGRTSRSHRVHCVRVSQSFAELSEAVRQGDPPILGAFSSLAETLAPVDGVGPSRGRPTPTVGL